MSFTCSETPPHPNLYQQLKLKGDGRWKQTSKFPHVLQNQLRPGTRTGDSHPQHDLFPMPPGLAKALNICGSLCSSNLVVSGQSHAVADLGLHWSPFQEPPKPVYLEVSFRPQQSTHPVSPTHGIPEGWSQQAPESPGASSAPWGKHSAQQPINCERGQIPQPVNLRINRTPLMCL